jgi:hypothetical protein
VMRTVELLIVGVARLTHRPSRLRCAGSRRFRLRLAQPGARAAKGIRRSLETKTMSPWLASVVPHAHSGCLWGDF